MKIVWVTDVSGEELKINLDDVICVMDANLGSKVGIFVCFRVPGRNAAGGVVIRGHAVFNFLLSKMNYEEQRDAV